jgi:phosphoglycerate kinase
MDKMIINQLSLDTLRGKRVFVRIDANAEHAPSGDFIDEYKVRSSLPTLKQLLAVDARLILGTHLGNPAGKVVDSLRLDGVAEMLSTLTGKSVRKLDETIGRSVIDAVAEMQQGEILLLENLCFNPGEEANDAHFAHDLAELCDIYCNDAFALAYRGLASTVGVTHYARPATAGIGLARELMMFDAVLNKPERPSLGIVAGARIEEKLPLLENLLPRLNVLFIGGALSFTFLKAQGYEVGASPVSEAFLPRVKDFLSKAKKNVEVILPQDFTVVDALLFKEFEDNGRLGSPPVSRQARADEILATDFLVDIGYWTQDHLKELIDDARTVVWNGPLGIWEVEPFAAGTRRIAHALIEREYHRAQRAIICGDSLSRAIRTSDLQFERIRHLTSGGESALQLLAGNPLPAAAALDDALQILGPLKRRKRIVLLAVDGSESSLEATGRISELIEAERTEIVLLYVQKPDTLKERTSNVERTRRREIERRLEAERIFRTANAVLARQGLVSHRQLAVDGDPAKEIVNSADEMDVDLIVIGSDSISGIRSLVVGSVSRKVTGHARQPVLIVRPQHEAMLSREAA